MKTTYSIGRGVAALAIGPAALASPVASAEDVNTFDGQWPASHSSVTSGNAILAVGYKFGWGDLVGGWRYLSYDMSSNAPTQKLIMSGPALGATFRW